MRRLLVLSLLLILCFPLAGHAEILTFESEILRLHFDLPEDWIQVEDPDAFMFMAPDESGVITVWLSDVTVTPEMAEGFSPEVVQEWIDVESGGGLSDVQMLLFAKDVDDDGYMYVLSSFGCMAGELPVIYSHYFFTAADGTLALVSALCINEDGSVTLAWLDQMILDNIPNEVLLRMQSNM